MKEMTIEAEVINRYCERFRFDNGVAVFGHPKHDWLYKLDMIDLSYKHPAYKSIGTILDYTEKHYIMKALHAIHDFLLLQT